MLLASAEAQKKEQSSTAARIAKLEALFSSPDQFDDPAQMAASGEQHRSLKEEAQSLWEEWERLSLESEGIDNRLRGLKVD